MPSIAKKTELTKRSKCLAQQRQCDSGSGQIKRLVYETPVPSGEDLIARTAVTAGSIPDMPRIFKNLTTTAFAPLHSYVIPSRLRTPYNSASSSIC
ncbi:hypothetical protein TNCV_3739041 [Trichonephila clavipes]|nr:hypothetical protein TNCV_3739041 [Trichonephila clavipes]